MSLERFIDGIKNTRIFNKHFIPSISNYKLGDIGRGYGAQLRNWRGEGFEKFYSDGSKDIEYKGIDQLADLIHTLKTNPMATKKTVTFWNPAEKEQCALTPCHWSFEVLVEPIKCTSNFCYEGLGCLDNVCKNSPKYKFTLKWHQHSVDTFLGLPFNIASYALLAQIIGKMTNMIPKGIIGDLSNVHIYKPHLEQVKEQLSRDVDKHGECELEFSTGSKNKLESLTNVSSLDSLMSSIGIDDFTLNGYESYPRIPAEMLPYNK